jgi:nucleotide-binding universal stress UspA family protein
MPSLTSSLDLRLKSVLVATDFSQASETALRHALAIARRYGAKFYLAHVVSSLGLTMAGPGAITASEEAVWRDAKHLEDDLVRSGALAGLEHEIVIREGEIWPQLEAIIREERIDLVIVGTHGRHGIGKLLLGSVAEQIFRHADCLVLTVGPHSYPDSRVEGTVANRTLLFTTDFGEASLHSLPYAISFANQFAAKLVLLHVVPAVPMPEGFHWYTTDDLMRMRENARIASFRRLEELTQNATLEVRPEFLVEFGSVCPVSEKILEAAEKLRVDVVIMGLRQSRHVGAASHLPWATAYEVACRAACPVLTVRSEHREG